MNPWLLAASLCTLLIGVAHSYLGEHRIFRHLRRRGRGIAPTHASPAFSEFQMRIIWGSWHLVTVFGLGPVALLFLAAQPVVAPTLRDQMVACAVVIVWLAATVVALTTRGKHPAWIALLLASAMAIAGIA